jgi:8-oxo-dGTP pyrophosphatase MutT (NUDIX family)
LHLFCCTLTLLKYLGINIWELASGLALQAPEAVLRRLRKMGAVRIPQHALPLQVAAVCYRRKGASIEFLLVNTNGGNKWTFPKGDPELSLSHGKAAAREAWEEAGVSGNIEPRHFCLYIHSKGVFWKPPGVREYVIKAFLLEVEREENPQETTRNPTWFSPDEARKILAKGREVKYARELQAVIDRAMERIGLAKAMIAQ